MKDPAHRDLMAELYRVYERYETTPPKPALDSYFRQLAAELGAVYDKHKDNPVAVELTIALLQGLANQADAKHKEV